jgi:hypothetical protein
LPGDHTFEHYIFEALWRIRLDKLETANKDEFLKETYTFYSDELDKAIKEDKKKEKNETEEQLSQDEE